MKPAVWRPFARSQATVQADRRRCVLIWQAHGVAVNIDLCAG